MARPTNITLCSFCGKSHAEVKKLIAGPGVYICDNCVVLCKNVLDKEMVTEARKTAPPPAPLQAVPKPSDIKRHLDVHCVGQEHAKKTLSLSEDRGVVSYVPGDLTLTVRAATAA